MAQLERGNEQNEVSRDAVYEQLYHEMRRHRDYEMLVSGWYATLVLGALAGLFAIRPTFQPCLLWLFGILIALAGAGVCYLVWYTHDRYESLRKFVDEQIEPSWRPKPPITQRKFKPHCVLIGINAMLTLAVIVVLAWFN